MENHPDAAVDIPTGYRIDVHIESTKVQNRRHVCIEVNVSEPSLYNYKRLEEWEEIHYGLLIIFDSGVIERIYDDHSVLQ